MESSHCTLIYYATERYDIGHCSALLELFLAKVEVANSMIKIINESMMLPEEVPTQKVQNWIVYYY
jgi:hypothetical protein